MNLSKHTKTKEPEKHWKKLTKTVKANSAMDTHLKRKGLTVLMCTAS